MSEASRVSESATEGVYFIVPFPGGWEVCAFRFNRYPDVGHALTWELMVAPQLALRWAPRLHSVATLEQSPELVIRLKNALAPLYDSVPRGRVVSPSTLQRKYRLYHGADLAPWMKIKRATVEESLGIAGTVVWLKDEHETRNTDSVDRLTRLLRIRLISDAGAVLVSGKVG